MWLNLRLTAVKTILGILIPILQGLTDYGKRLAKEAGIYIPAKKIEDPKIGTDTFTVYCVVCNYVWHERVGMKISDSECPLCSAPAVPIANDR